MATAHTPAHEARVPRGITVLLVVVVLVSAVLAAAALRLSGHQATLAFVLLGLLSPIALVVGTRVGGRSYRNRIESLETAIADEHRSRRRQTDGYTGLLEELSTFFNVVSIDAAEAKRIVDTMTIAALLDSGTYRPQLSNVDLDRHVAQTVEAMGRPSLDISFDVRPASVWSDPTAIRLVLLNTLHTAVAHGASKARIDVEERHGLGTLSIMDNRSDQSERNSAPDRLICSGTSLAHDIIPALVENQGGTMSENRTLGWYNTIIRVPIATPAQLASPPPQALADPIV
ncbi:MAG: hypothetical protein ABFR89_05335 [Actinomycetota bacterium]